MTISKERFEQLALEVAKEKDSNWSQSVNFYKDFAHALIKRVEEELINDTSFISDSGTLTSLVELPIVSEE